MLKLPSMHYTVNVICIVGPVMTRPKLLIVLLYMAFTSTTSFAKESITWVKWTLTPEYIETGEFKGLGYLDQLLEHTIQLLPEYDHKVQFQTLNRINLSWEEGNVCSLHLWLGYWPDKIVYSQPYGFTPRFGVAVRKDTKIGVEFVGQNSISLEYLLSATEYKMGILPLYYTGTSNSRYPLLAPLINAYAETGKVVEFSNGRNEMSVDFLDKNRVDYVIRQRITHLSELRINKLDNNYRYYYLEEGLKHKLVAAACSNSEFGKKVIKRFNSLIDDSFYRTYIKLRQLWDKENFRFEKIYEDYFLKGIKNPIVTE